jgi:Uma2 family endonuclease
MMRGTGIPACGRSGTAPDLVVEMLSPSTARLDLKARRRAYATAGVAAWWVFPSGAENTSVFRFQP